MFTEAGPSRTRDEASRMSSGSLLLRLRAAWAVARIALNARAQSLRALRPAGTLAHPADVRKEPAVPLAQPAQLPSQSPLRQCPALVARLVATVLAVFAPALVPVFADEVADPHAMHHHMMMAPQTTRSVADYKVPDLKLVRDDEKSVSLRDELDDGRPVVLSFIYTSCTTICPMTSVTLSELQAKLGAARDSVHLMSISIDPEQDTPARLRAYAKQFGAGPQWRHYSGTLASSVAVQQAFGVYVGDKMNHRPVTLLRPAPGGHWIRIDGFASSQQMLAELQHVGAAQ